MRILFLSETFRVRAIEGTARSIQRLLSHWGNRSLAEMHSLHTKIIEGPPINK